MCGIIAFLGYVSGIHMCYEGLIILKNRGYDSVGISSILNNDFIIHKHVNTSDKNAFDLLGEHIEKHSKCNNLIGHN